MAGEKLIMSDAMTSAAGSPTPAEVMFYHLERQPVETILPKLVEKTVERGWRAVIQVSSAEWIEALDAALWTYSDESFLAHGTEKSGSILEQPVYITAGHETPNGAGVRFLIDGAVAASFSGPARIIFLFNGNDPDTVASARSQWRAAKAAGCKLTYWQQSDSGRWEQKA